MGGEIIAVIFDYGRGDEDRCSRSNKEGRVAQQLLGVLSKHDCWCIASPDPFLASPINMVDSPASSATRAQLRVAPLSARNDARTTLPARPARPGPSDPTSDPRFADILSSVRHERLPGCNWVWDNGARRDRPDAFFRRPQTSGERPNRNSPDHPRPSNTIPPSVHEREAQKHDLRTETERDAR